jgi:hypothetical protein
MKKVFQVKLEDNVATSLDDLENETVEIISGAQRTIVVREIVKLGHKIALVNIGENEAIIKYGVRIGHATREIAAGEWVHLHNCASDYDERSNTLDNDTGAPTDSTDAYV